MKKRYFIAALIATILFAITTTLTSCKKCDKCTVETTYYVDGVEQFDQEESDRVKNCDYELENGITRTYELRNGVEYTSKTITTCETLN